MTSYIIIIGVRQGIAQSAHSLLLLVGVVCIPISRSEKEEFASGIRRARNRVQVSLSLPENADNE